MNSLTEYKKFKDLNATNLVKVNAKAFALSVKRYDQGTGAPADDLVHQLSIDAVKANIADGEAQLIGLRALLADMEALGK